MADVEKARRNVKRLIQAGASEHDVEAYLDSEGVSGADLRGEKSSPGKFIDNIGRRIASGATFGYADEIAAKMNSLTGGGTYQENVAKERETDRRFMDDHPVAATTAELVGAVANPLTRGFSMGKNLANAPRYLGYAMQGAGMGAASGSGNSTEGNRLDGARSGGLWGAGLGVALPAGLQIGGAAVRGGANYFSSQGTQAGRSLSRAFVRDGLTIEDAQRRLAELGPEATMADLGGNVRGLAEASASQPGKSMKAAKDVYTARQMEQGDRVIRHALDATGSESVEALIKARSDAARPLYETAFSQDVHRTVRSKKINDILARPKAQQALREGIDDVLDEAAITGQDTRAFNDVFDGADLNDPNLRLVKEPTLRVIDAVKRGYDRMLNGKTFKDEFGRPTGEWHRINEARATLLSEVDDAMKGTTEGDAYKAAREAWAGPSDLINVLSKITKKVENARDKTDVTGALFGSKAARADLRKLFPDQQSFSAFAAKINAEQTFAETGREVLGNSRTAYRTAAQNDMASDGMDAAFEIMQNPTSGTAIRTGTRALRNWATRPPTEVADELAAPLFSADRGVQMDAMDQLRRRVQLGSLLRTPGMAALHSSAKIGGYSGGLLGGSNQ